MKKNGVIFILTTVTVLLVFGCNPELTENVPSRQGGGDFLMEDFAVITEPSSGEGKLPELNEDSGLSDYLAYAALNNSQLKSAFNKWQAALEKLPQVRSLPDPKFNYKYYIEEVETRVGPQRQSFGISQTFPWFGKLKLRESAAGLAAMATQKRYEAAKLKLFYEVKNAWYEYYYLAKSIDITKENVQLISHLETISRNRYKTAAGTHPDVMRAQVELGKLQDRYQSLVDLKEPVAAGLNAAMNRSVDIEIPLPKKIEFDDIDGEIVAKAVEQNPELKAMDFEVTENRHKIALAKKDYYPDFTFGVNFIDTRDTLAGNPNDNGKDPVVASVSVNLPIWRAKYDAGVRQARRRYFAAKHDRRQKANSLAAELKMSLYRFRDAKRKIALYKDALIPKATESLKVTESGFRAGRGTFTDIVDAQRSLLEFAHSYERALTDKHQALAKIEMLTGTNN